MQRLMSVMKASEISFFVFSDIRGRLSFEKNGRIVEEIIFINHIQHKSADNK
jgi:hypothetical protein